MDTSCKPEHRYINLDDEHRIEVILVGGTQRYIPQYWQCDPHYVGTGFWLSAIPVGTHRLSLREARNDCAHHAKKKVID